MIFCAGCGCELIADANFCKGCGRPLGTAVTKPAAPEGDASWESCKISFSRRVFHAVVSTPRGSYSILDPQRRLIRLKDGSPYRQDKTTARSHAALVERLLREGWQPCAGGGEWWKQELRRRAGERQWESCEIIVRKRRFVADAIDHERQYDAATSAKLNGMTRRAQIDKGAAALLKLLTELRLAGWQHAAQIGSEPWQQRWQRRLTA